MWSLCAHRRQAGQVPHKAPAQLCSLLGKQFSVVDLASCCCCCCPHTRAVPLSLPLWLPQVLQGQRLQSARQLRLWRQHYGAEGLPKQSSGRVGDGVSGPKLLFSAVTEYTDHSKALLTVQDSNKCAVRTRRQGGGAVAAAGFNRVAAVPDGLYWCCGSFKNPVSRWIVER